jgi:hypothetical protein
VAGRLVVLLVVPALLAAGLAALVAWASSRSLGPDPTRSESVAAARRHAALILTAAWIALAAVALAGAPLAESVGRSLGGGPGAGIALAVLPATGGVLFLGVLAVGELTWPRPAGRVRTAALARRTVAELAPRWLRVLTWAWAVLLAATLVACGLVADDGHAFSTITTDATGAVVGSHRSSPFPGWRYGVPLLVATAVVMLAAEGVLRLVAARPAVTGAPDAVDRALRTVSAGRALRGAQLVLGTSLTAVLAVAGSVLQRHDVGVGAVMLVASAAVALTTPAALVVPTRVPGPVAADPAGETAADPVLPGGGAA